MSVVGVAAVQCPAKLHGLVTYYLRDFVR